MSVVVNYQPIWVKEDFIDFLLEKLNPMLTLKRCVAKVIEVNALPDNMTEVVLKPNHHYLRHEPGQFVLVTVELDGVKHQRAYSIVSDPENQKITIAAKQQGRVSNYLKEHLKVGDVIEISQPQGEFLLTKAPVGMPLLFIAAGSGITPVISMINQALKDPDRHITLLYYSRDPAYADHLKALSASHENVDLHIVVDSELAPAVFDHNTLDHLNINPEKMHTFLCGAPGLMKAVNTMWQERGIFDQLTQELFFSPEPDNNTQRHKVTFRERQKSFESQGNILVSAEKAGLSLSYGCRMGICNTCACQKVSGTVKNQVTGTISNNPNEKIKLCISEALSPLEIDA